MLHAAEFSFLGGVFIKLAVQRSRPVGQLLQSPLRPSRPLREKGQLRCNIPSIPVFSASEPQKSAQRLYNR